MRKRGIFRDPKQPGRGSEKSPLRTQTSPEAKRYVQKA